MSKSSSTPNLDERLSVRAEGALHEAEALLTTAAYQLGVGTLRGRSALDLARSVRVIREGSFESCKACHGKGWWWESRNGEQWKANCAVCGGAGFHVPHEVQESGWQWRPVDADTAFAPPFSTIRVCSACGCLVAGGPAACGRCVAHEEAKP